MLPRKIRIPMNRRPLREVSEVGCCSLDLILEAEKHHFVESTLVSSRSFNRLWKISSLNSLS